VQNGLESNDLYSAGQKIGSHLAKLSENEITPALLQALIRDYLPEHEDIQEALRSIVSRTGFIDLLCLAKKEKGAVQKESLLESLKKIYNIESVVAVENLIKGILSPIPPIYKDISLEQTEEVSIKQQESANVVILESEEPEKLEPEKSTLETDEQFIQHLDSVSKKGATPNAFTIVLLVAIPSFTAIWALNISTNNVDTSVPQIKQISSEIIPPSMEDWDVCRAAQDVRLPTSIFGESGEYAKPLSNGLGRFAPPANTAKEATWVKYSCSQIPGIYSW
jgi:hypothetical protein